MRRRFFNKAEDLSKYYLTFDILEDNTSISLSDSVIYENLRYSINGGEFQVWGGWSFYVNGGDIVYFTAFNIEYDQKRNCGFIVSKPFTIRGNILSISNNLLGLYKFLFAKCPVISVANDFLPATTLVDNCYESMFSGCTSLTTAPELPATTLTGYCYKNMFYNCRSLNYIKMLATDISATNCLSNWVYGVASTGTFVKNPAMTSLPTGTSGIPSGWTVVNDGEESGGNLITFTIDGVEYQAEEGMTWGEWVNSEYNTGNFIIDAGALTDTMGLGLPVNSGGMVQMSTYEIISGYSYIIG